MHDKKTQLHHHGILSRRVFDKDLQAKEAVFNQEQQAESAKQVKPKAEGGKQKAAKPAKKQKPKADSPGAA